MANISSTFQTLYDAEVISRFQSKSRLAGKTKEKAATDSHKVQFRIGGYGIAQPHVSGAVITPMSSGITGIDVTLTDWDAFDYVDGLDADKNNLDDVQELAEIASTAIGTRSDQIRINALVNGFDSANMSVGTDATLLTLDTLAAAQYKLNLKDCPDEDRVFVYHPAALDGLLKDQKFTSNEYLSEKKQLTEVKAGTGRVALGFEFVRIAPRPNGSSDPFGLPTREASGAKSCSNFVFQKNAVGYAYNPKIKTKIGWVEDRQAYMVGGQLSAGAAVLVQDWICEVKCKVA